LSFLFLERVLSFCFDFLFYAAAATVVLLLLRNGAGLLTVALS
jgi:hypothetical protein